MLTLFRLCALLGSSALLFALLAVFVPSRTALPGHDRGTVRLPSRGPTGQPDSWQPSFWPSLRGVASSLVSFAAFFGLGGLLASWLGFSSALQLLFALLAGLAVGGFTAFAFQLARRRGGLVGQHQGGQTLVGRTGRVLVSPYRSSPGRVLLTADSEEHPLAHSNDALLPGDRVLVIADSGGLLDVRRWDGQ